VGDYGLGLLRLALLVVPALVGSRAVRSMLGSLPSRSLGWLVDAIVAVSALVVGSELLGVLTLDRWWALTLALWVAGLAAVAVARRRQGSPATPASRPAARAGISPRAAAPRQQPGADLPADRWSASRVQFGVAVVAVAVVAGQWALLTSDAYGGGILSFDSLWYHLPFSAFFAQTGSVSRVLFTQADPFVAYYPANSELLHGVALIAMRSDLLSPMLNLVWLAVALLAAWCFGRPWRVEPITLTAGCLLMAVPILGAGQPGSAFNDIFGLAFLIAAIALLVQVDDRFGMTVICGSPWALPWEPR
jgi:hypothetical protein